MRKGSARHLSEVNPDDRALGRRDMSFKKKDEKVAFERTLGKYQAGLEAE